MGNKTKKCICGLEIWCCCGYASSIVIYFEVQSASLGSGHILITADHGNISLGVHFLEDMEMIGL
jgi:hypothetical protein